MSMNMKRLFLIVTAVEVTAAVAIGLSLLTSCKGVTEAKTTKTYATLTLAPTHKALYTRYTTTLQGCQDVEVRRGQTLFVIDQVPYLAALKTAIAQVEIAKAQQEEARLNFHQSLLNAGSEVSNALYQFHSAGEKSGERTHQITALEQSVKYTQALMRLGTSTYLEVLTAQQSLLTAQLTQVSDQFEQMQAVINLYQALGGGR